MSHYQLTTATIALLLVTFAGGCSSDTPKSDNQASESSVSTDSEHAHDGGEHAHDGGEHSGEGRGEHDRDGQSHHGEEGEESGTEYALNENYDETRHGARLLLAYDEASNSFQGTVENTTGEVLERVRVEVHLSNGRELGPTAPADLKPREKREITLTATSTGFEGFSAHPEVGNREHGHGEKHGEHEHDGGEHGGEHKEGDSD